MPTVCLNCGAVLDAGAACARCGYEPGSARSSLSQPPPIHIAESGELRDATVLFCDLGGYTAWNEEEEPEAVVPVMDRIKLQAIRIFEEHGGIANQFVGDEILGLFGVTSSNEDDPCRAISAALELHAYVRAQLVHRPNGERRMLDLHTGIETGCVYVRVTDSRGGVFDVTGDTVNTAARLRSLAEPGQIWVGPATHDRIATVFETEALVPTPVRGKQQMVLPHRVIGRVKLSSPFEPALVRRGLTGYVGGEQNLALLEEAWQRTCAGEGALITVEGPAGIGKSRLFYEFCRYVHGQTSTRQALVLHARCSAYSVAPYQPFIDALIAQLDETRGGQEGLIAQLGAFAPISSMSLSALSYLIAPGAMRSEDQLQAGEQLRHAIVQALSELVERISRDRPLLIALEDFHDADEASRAALRRIVQEASSRRVMFLINYRPGETNETLRALGGAHLQIQPLDDDTTRALACGVLGATSLAPELAAFIHARTLGNPFFVEEVCRSLVEREWINRRFGFAVPTKSLELSRSPPSVQSIVRSRVERLPSEHRKALRLASVLGLEFTADALEKLWANPRPPNSALVADGAWRRVPPPALSLGMDELLADLEAQRLIDTVGDAARPTYRFQHAITQEVVYESLPRQERRWYHGLFAAWTEEQCAGDGLEAQYETLAHHYGLSAKTAEAIAYAVRSGDKAWRSFSLEQASAQYRRAIALLRSVVELDEGQKRSHIEVSIRWARVGLYNPHHDQVEALCASERYARELNDARGSCLCHNWTSWIEYALGNQAQAHESSTAFLAAALRLNEDGLTAQALTNLGLSHTIAAEYSQAIDLIEKGIQRRGRANGTAHAYSMGYLALIRGDQGEFALAAAHLEEAASIARSDTLQGPLMIQRGMVQAWRGDWTACLETARLAHVVADRISGHYIRAMSLALEGYCLGMLAPAQRELGIVRLEQAVTTLEALGIKLHLSWCYALLAEQLALVGKLERARESALSALTRAAENDRLGEAAALRVLATVSLRHDRDVESATGLLERALDAANRKGSSRELALTQLAFAELFSRTETGETG